VLRLVLKVISSLLVVTFFFSLTLPLHAEEQKVLLDLIINQSSQQPILVIVKGEQILIKTKDLKAAGLEKFSGEQTVINGENYTLLNSLSSILSYQLNLEKFSLDLTVQTEHLKLNIIDLYQSNRPDNIVYTEDSSFFLNYSVGTIALSQLVVAGEMAWNWDNVLLYSNINIGSDRNTVRGLSNITLDNREDQTRWIIGDNLVNTGDLGGGGYIGGVTYTTERSLDPYQPYSPFVDIPGEVALPSTATLYINERQVRQIDLSPGPFILKNLSVPTGASRIGLKIKDSAGQEKIFDYPSYTISQFIPPGKTEFVYGLGIRRNNLNNDSWSYGTPVATAYGSNPTSNTTLGNSIFLSPRDLRIQQSSLLFIGKQRYGISNNLSAGFRVEAAPNFLNGGVQMTTRLPLGEINLSAAVSQFQGRFGSAAALSYSTSGSNISLSALIRILSPQYANASLLPTDDRNLLEFNLAASLSLSRAISLYAFHSSAPSRYQKFTQRDTIGLNINLASQLTISLSGSRYLNQGQEPDNQLFVGLSYALGNNRNASLTLQRQSERNTLATQIRQNVPTDTGFGFSVQGQSQDSQTVNSNFNLQYQAPFGLYGLTFNSTSQDSPLNFNVAGSLVLIDGHFYFSRSIQNSFALVQIPNVPGVVTYVNGQDYGTTNQQGYIFLPNLQPNYGNQIRISADDLPLAYNTIGTSQVIAPPYRGGGIIRFVVEKTQAVTGLLRVKKGKETLIPAYGEISVEGNVQVSPIGEKGEFYLDNLKPGTHQAKIDFKEGICQFSLNVAESKAIVTNLGTLTCTLP
jgi:outer membrane usher protein